MRIVVYLLQWGLIGLGAAAAIVLALRGTDLLTAPANGHAATMTGYAAAVARAAPTVVEINAVGPAAAQNPLTQDPLFREFFGVGETSERARATSSLGSGVILDASGVIVTNFHVVRDAERIRVSLADGRQTAAEVVGTDPDTDLAVLRVRLGALPAITVADSDALAVGDVVLAIGNALGIGQTVTQGIVSATGRNRVGINTFENFIQTDAAINFGNSGGALINPAGELVGINSVRIGAEGIGFAIPSSIAVPVVRQLLDNGTVSRGWIGIDARDLSPGLVTALGVERGIVVLDVLGDGPADRAGVRPRDVLTHIAGEPIVDSRDATERIAAHQPGNSIALTGVRDGAAYSTTVTVSRRPSAGAATVAP